MKEITIYTDGACRGNPGPGGYGTVLVHGEHRRELSGGFIRTTNNRMEIYAVLAGLRALKEPCMVTVVSDSRYVVDTMTKGWAKGWRARGWKRSTGERAINPDLWEEMLLLATRHKLTFQWVRGHSGHVENERCDELAVAAAASEDLRPDPGFA